MKRLTIGVDVDGVLGNFTGAARHICRKLFNGRPAEDAVQTDWGFDSLGMTKDEEDQMYRFIDTQYDWWLELPVLANTDLLRSVCDEHKVIFITNRKSGLGLPVEEQTKAWLYWNYHILHPTVLVSNDKGPLCKALGLDYFIDDRDKNVREVSEAIGQQKVIMNRWPWQPEFQKFHPYWVHNFNEFAFPLLQQDAEINYGRCVA